MFTSTTLPAGDDAARGGIGDRSFAYTPAGEAQEVVSGPAAEPECFVPGTTRPSSSSSRRRMAVSHRARQRLHRQNLAHPDDQDAKAYADQPEVAAKLKEFKVVSTARTLPRRSPRSTTSSIPAMTPSRQRAKPDCLHAGDQACKEAGS